MSTAEKKVRKQYNNQMKKVANEEIKNAFMYSNIQIKNLTRKNHTLKISLGISALLIITLIAGVIYLLAHRGV